MPGVVHLRVILSLVLTLASGLSPAAHGPTLPAPAGSIAGSVVNAQHAPLVGIRVILGELGHGMLFYNSPADMFATAPGIPAPESKRFASYGEMVRLLVSWKR